MERYCELFEKKRITTVDDLYLLEMAELDSLKFFLTEGYPIKKI